MTWLVFVLAALGGGVGAALRFVVDGLATRALGTRFPWGIFIVNASGSLLLGLVTGLADGDTWVFVVGAGVLGGYTTFSTAMLDTVELLGRRAWGWALCNALGMLVVTIVAALVGLFVGRLV